MVAPGRFSQRARASLVWACTSSEAPTMASVASEQRAGVWLGMVLGGFALLCHPRTGSAGLQDARPQLSQSVTLVRDCTVSRWTMGEQRPGFAGRVSRLRRLRPNEEKGATRRLSLPSRTARPTRLEHRNQSPDTLSRECPSPDTPSGNPRGN